MKHLLRIQPFVLTFVVAVTALASLRVAQAQPALSLDGDAKRALNALYERSADAKALGANAKAILVFPGIQKIGLILGAQFGEGAMFKDRTVIDYYRLIGVMAGQGLMGGIALQGVKITRLER